MSEHRFNVPVNLLGLELRNARFQSLAAAPTGAEALFYYDSIIKTPRYHDGTGWFNLDPRKATNIPLSALATDPLARANHTGTQTASTISNFDTQVRTSRLDQMAAPTAAVNLNNQRITSLATPTVATDAASKGYVDSASTTGNAATATALQTSRTFSLSGVVTATGIGFDGTGNVNLSTAIADAALTIAKTSGLQAALDGKQASLGYTPVNRAGDTMTGLLTLSGDPSNPLHAATKQYVDTVVANAASGLDPKDAVRTATTANITLSGTQTVGAVAVVAGDRVLVKNQTNAAENGIYVVAAGAWSRASDAIQGRLTTGALTLVLEGTHAGQQWYLQTSGTITVGTTNQTWIQFATGATYNAGNGLDLVGGTFSVRAHTGISVTASGVAIDTTLVPRKVVSATFGDGTTQLFEFTHNLNTRALVVFLRDVNTNLIEYASYTANTVNTVQIQFATVPTAGQYQAIILG